RENLPRDDYRDPGPYVFPTGSVAYEVETLAPQPHQDQSSPPGEGAATPMKAMKMRKM
ncbi:unnamed protein product, partial [marine sediment metagenome]